MDLYYSGIIPGYVENGYTAKKFIGSEATSIELIDTLLSFADTLKRGDGLFISYSGHGTRVKDLNKDQNDAYDEVLVLYDRLFIDDEFQLLWLKFNEGVRIFFINDSCYNGSVTRFFLHAGTKAIFPDHVLRGVSKSQANIDFERNVSFYKSIKLGSDERAKPVCSILHIGACRDNQLADDGVATDNNGKFTMAVKTIY